MTRAGLIRTGAQRAAVVTVATVLGVVLTANLGFWQLRRAAQKHALQSALDSQAVLPVLTAGDITPTLGGVLPALLEYRRVRLQGRWLGQQTVFLENRQMKTRVGFYVVTPLQLSGRPESILVQRGWVPRDLRDRTLLPPLATPAGEVEVTGLIAPPPARLYEFAASSSGVIRQNLDLPAFASETGLRLLPMSVQQAESAAAQPGRGSVDRDGLMRAWPRPAVNIEMHYGYAFQWFALCALMAGLYVWFQVVRPWLGRRARR